MGGPLSPSPCITTSQTSVTAPCDMSPAVADRDEEAHQNAADFLDRTLELTRRSTASQYVTGTSCGSFLQGCRLVYDRTLEESTWRASLLRARAARSRFHPDNSRENHAAEGHPTSSDDSFALPTECPPPALNAPLCEPLQNEGPLRFTAAFESGNLCRAWLSLEPASDSEHADKCDASYELIMQPDTLSHGHTQWFCFAAQPRRHPSCSSQGDGNRKPDAEAADSNSELLRVRFRLLNFRKDRCLYKNGLRPAVWDSAAGGRWRSDLCQDVDWKVGPLEKTIEQGSRPVRQKQHSALTFTYTFKPNSPPVFFAYSHPYTLSFLYRSIALLEAQPDRQNLLKRQSLVTGLGGSSVDLLEISEAPEDCEVMEQAPSAGQGKDSSAASAALRELCPRSFRRLEQMRQKPVILLVARQHPSEPQGSWMAHGLLEFLTDPNDPRAREMRRKYSFHVIPMLNPDGVLFGNSRCNAGGQDPNRQWLSPTAASSPEVRALRQHIEDLPQGCYCCIDLHGHSSKRGIFFYSCSYGSGRKYRGSSDDANPTDLKLLAQLAARESADVHLASCRSSMPSCKRKTLRCVLFNELKIKWVYTVEASVYAVHESAAQDKDDEDAGDTGVGDNVELKSNVADVENGPAGLLTSSRLFDFGVAIGVALYKLIVLDRRYPDAESQQLLEEFRVDGGYSDEEVDSEIGSDSCPSDDNFEELEAQTALAELAARMAQRRLAIVKEELAAMESPKDSRRGLQPSVTRRRPAYQAGGCSSSVDGEADKQLARTVAFGKCFVGDCPLRDGDQDDAVMIKPQPSTRRANRSDTSAFGRSRRSLGPAESSVGSVGSADSAAGQWPVCEVRDISTVPTINLLMPPNLLRVGNRGSAQPNFNVWADPLATSTRQSNYGMVETPPRRPRLITGSPSDGVGDDRMSSLASWSSDQVRMSPASHGKGSLRGLNANTSSGIGTYTSPSRVCSPTSPIFGGSSSGGASTNTGGNPSPERIIDGFSGVGQASPTNSSLPVLVSPTGNVVGAVLWCGEINGGIAARLSLRTPPVHAGQIASTAWLPESRPERRMGRPGLIGPPRVHARSARMARSTGTLPLATINI